MGDIFLELEKVKIHRIQQNGTAVSQITLDDDYNVPDYRPDIMKVLKENGELRFDEVKAANKAVWVKGSLVFHILYLPGAALRRQTERRLPILTMRSWRRRRYRRK